MKKLAATLAVALAVPGLALAAKPPAPGTHNTQTTTTTTTTTTQTTEKAPHSTHAKTSKVLYVLKGTLTAYTAADGTTDGSVSILVKRANRHGRALKKQTLTFAVSAKTRIVLHKGAPIAANDKGVVKLRAPRRVKAGEDLATVLQTITAKQVIDRGASS